MAQPGQGTLAWACGCNEDGDALIPCAKPWCMRSEMEPGEEAQSIVRNDLRIVEAELKAHETHSR